MSSSTLSGATLLAEPQPLEPLDDADSLARAIITVLSSTCRAFQLSTLSVRVSGRPELAIDVRCGVPTHGSLTSWGTVVPGDAWHDGLTVVATAPEADRPRRGAVRDAAGVVSELIVVHSRRAAAEDLAERAVELAGRDALTELGNRRAWRRALDQERLRAARYGGSSSIVIVDLDGLKHLNDEQGHAAGDLHLQRASAAIRAASRTVDVVCRLGGDEFAVLAPETDEEGAKELSRRLRHELQLMGVRASIGTATAEDGDLERAWQEADAEMYTDKRRARSPERSIAAQRNRKRRR